MYEKTQKLISVIVVNDYCGITAKANVSVVGG